ncbi:hypothetical protein JL475_09005 [Streptomyces sp. M2CJ-2]|uniref:hypothetical protein n=1 Tax=Streptomyces sp. M2CJ-2 TaxID=2803948 RepID=UPI001921287D|nr:hypothetical protein [Streptomyces sp. M2CJ-2]MBL3666131.1 hypothetical protein [Streptomyces sp. M2CJ-2]
MPPPSAATVSATGTVLLDPAPIGTGDAVGGLMCAAVSDRPLEEVADLITSLARSPEHTPAVVDALRAVGVGRSVEDVARLVALLTRPPRDADSADEVIRAAAAHRPVADVTRLVTLLQNEELAPHCREEALRAAASGRSVEELIELIDRLAAQEPPERPGSPTAVPSAPPRSEDDHGDEGDDVYGDRHRAPYRAGSSGRDGGGERRGTRDDEVVGGGRGTTPEAGHRTVRRGARGAAALRSRRRIRHHRPRARTGQGTGPGRRPDGTALEYPPEQVDRSLTWSSWLAAVALALCAVAHFPLHCDGSALGLHAFTVGLSVLCTALALILVVRPGALVLAPAVVVPAALVGAHACGPSFPSVFLSRAVRLALAPQWLASAAAVTAALLALTALVVRVASPFPGRHWAVWPAPGTHRMPD